MSEENVRPEIANMAPEQMERVLAETQPNVPEAKPTLFEHDKDAQLTKELGAAYDKAEGKAEFILGKKDVPSAKTDNFDSAFDATYKWLHETPKAEQERMRDANALVEQVKQNALKFGVTLTDEQAMSKAMEIEYTQSQDAKANAEYQPAIEAMRSVYKDHDPNQTAQWFSQVKQSFDRDPVGAVMWAAQEYNISPMQLAQQIAQRFGQQQNQPTQQDVNRLYGIVAQAYQQNPRIAELEQDVLDELASTKRSGDPAADLSRAVQKAEQKNRKRSTGDRISRSMNATFDRVAGRKR